MLYHVQIDIVQSRPLTAMRLTTCVNEAFLYFLRAILARKNSFQMYKHAKQNSAMTKQSTKSAQASFKMSKSPSQKNNVRRIVAMLFIGFG